MAINRVDFPTTPNPVSGDWEKIVNIVTKSFQNVASPLQVNGLNIPQGATFQVGGVVYYADADTSITGTSSDYVKLTPSGDGSTLSAAFVSSLTGVTWNKIYNGYYDTSQNLYIFDEIKAILAGTLSGSYSKFSQLWNNNFNQRLKTTDSPTFASINTGTINTGHGSNELYPMNQALETTDSPTFASINIGNIALKRKLISGLINGTAIYIPHGLNQSDIRGIATTTPYPINYRRVTASDVQLFFDTTTTGNAYIVIDYV